jgi:membrane-bound inhibitor of C-type lysozyme
MKKPAVILLTLLLIGCSHLHPAKQDSEVIHYQCGTLPLTVTISHANGSASLILDGELHQLALAANGKTKTYRNDHYTLVQQNDSAYLERDDHRIIQDCVRQ